MQHSLPGTLVLLFSSLGSFGCSPKPLTPEEAGNVILIVVDTMRADATDGTWTRTPNIERLGRDGVPFSRAFSHAPSTLPAHTALFASRPPHQTGVLNNGDEVPEPLPLLAEHLSGHGYQTRAIVSLGTLNRRRSKGNPGLTRGFDDYDQNYWHIDHAAGALARMRASLDQLDAARPFFLFAHFSDPHSPYSARQAEPKRASIFLDGRLLEETSTSSTATRRLKLELQPGEHIFEIKSEHGFIVRDFEVRKGRNEVEGIWSDGDPKMEALVHSHRLTIPTADTYEFRYWMSEHVPNESVRENYRSEVEYVDGFVGLLLDELKLRGWYQDSLILFSSDHGESLGNPGRAGHIETLSDELLHVPLVIKLPRRHRGASLLQEQDSQLVPLIDLVPTILEVVGLPSLPGQQGHSLLQPHTSILIAETHRPEARRNYLGLRDERYKMVYAPDLERFAMFDLLNDPGEKRNVFRESQGLRAGWADQLKQISLIAPEWEPLGDPLTLDELSDLEALGYTGSDAED